MEQLWELDENRLTPGVDYVLDLQGRTKFSYDGPDKAEDPLFAKVEADVFERPTYKGKLYLGFMYWKFHLVSALAMTSGLNYRSF